MAIITLPEVRGLLSIPNSDTSRDGLIATLIPLVQERVMKYCNNSFDFYNIQSYDSSFTFDSSANTITDSNSNFVVNNWKADLEFRIAGSLYNDGIYTVKTVTAGVLTTKEDIVDESPSDTPDDDTIYILLQAIKFPTAVKIPVSIYIDWLSRNNHHVLLSERAGDWSGQYKTEAQVLSQFNAWRK